MLTPHDLVPLRMIRLTSWLTRLGPWSMLSPLAVLIALGIGVAVSSVDPRLVMYGEGSLPIALICFITLQRLCGLPSTTIRGLGTFLVGAASVFVTMNGLRALPISATGLLPSATISDLLLVPACLVLAIAWFTERFAWPLYPPTIALGVALLAASAAVTSVVDASHRPTGLFFFAAIALTPLVVAASAPNFRTCQAIGFLWLMSGGLNGAIAVTDVAGLTRLGPDLTGYVFVGRGGGLADSVNHLGLSVAMVVPIGAALIFSSRSLALRVASACFTASAAAGVLESGSRAATLAALLGFVAVPLMARYRRARALVVCCGALACGGLALSVAQPELVSLERLTGGVVGVAGSNQAHLTAWAVALQLIPSSPIIGSGYANVGDAHDIVLQLLVSGGVLALIGFALFTIGFIVIGWRSARDTRLGTAMQTFSAGLTASALVFLATGLVGDLIYDRFLYWPFGLLLAIHILRKGLTYPLAPITTPALPGAIRSARAE